ncbi:TraR/DksA family transcriptional regulator (plasmid) [Streptomyces sp. CA-294286]|uniref:TraR/DksA family transcriptional regulator n=1 Tax=Streptomyces sp. CA-294286 TaxID=3240070 RepID=UPI003D8EA49A
MYARTRYGCEESVVPDDLGSQELHEQLAAQAEVFRRRAASAEAVMADLRADCDLDAADAASTRAALAEEHGRAEEARRQLARTTAALHRLDEGTFGLCATCGAAIDPERLLAVPHTRWCVACRRDAEDRPAR